MGNIVDSVETQLAEEDLSDSDSSDSLQSLQLSADEAIIDLDAPEYQEYLKHKRKISRSEGNLSDISYLDWAKTNNVKLISSPLNGSDLEINDDKFARRRSAPITQNDFFAVEKNSDECEKRKLGSKKRIEDIKNKYNLKDRDYSARMYVWNEADEQEIRREREDRKRLRKQIREKYNLQTPSVQRQTAVAKG